MIFGLGFTGRRVASSLLSRGMRVVAGVRDPARFGDLISLGLETLPLDLDSANTPEFPLNSALLHSIPPLAQHENTALRILIERIAPRRVVYISATSVYGDQIDVSEVTPVSPADPRGVARVEEEQWITAHSWSTLILRAAAIYGPGRGVHTSLREGRVPRGAASGIVSRIHVDDLATLAEAGLLSDVTGAWPVADDHPCETAEIVEWFEGQFRPSLPPAPRTDFPIHGRRVNGAAIRQKLGIQIQYPSWHTGLPASIAAEG